MYITVHKYELNNSGEWNLNLKKKHVFSFQHWFIKPNEI